MNFRKKYYRYEKKGMKIKYEQETIDNIRTDYSTGEYSLRKLNEKYGVSHEWIRKIVNGENRKSG